MLNDSVEEHHTYNEETLKTLSKLVEIKLEDYGVKVSVVAVNQGPVITRFELEPEAGVKAGEDNKSFKRFSPRIICIKCKSG